MKKDGNPKNDHSLAARMKRLREENQLTQRQVADVLNLERSSVAKYELGQSTPNPETLLKMSKIFNVSVDYLVGGLLSVESQVVLNSSSAPYKTNNNTLPLIDTQSMSDLTVDEQFLVLYFRLLDRNAEILDILRQKYNDRTPEQDN